MYVTLAYQKKGTAYQPYVRYDNFNPNTDAAGLYYNRYTAGLNYYINNNNKLTVEYEKIKDGANPTVKNFYGAQYQVSF